MNFLQFIIGRQLAINQGVGAQQATTDGLISMMLRQPLGLIFALFVAKNQAANQPQVSLIASTTALAVTPAQDPAGKLVSPVAFAATVTQPAPKAALALPAPAAPVPSGMIAFTETTSGRPVVIGSIPLDPKTGKATLSGVVVSAGAHTYVAIYSGDGNFQPSSSPNAAPITIT
jgi:hypothetical protein